MAKNIFQAKKRVSHFQKTHKDIDGENELFGCKDYVSSIIQDMDSNFSYIQSGYSKKGIESNEMHLSPSEDNFLNIPVLKIPSPPFTNGTLQIPVKHTNHKKFSFSKKFPLMEKSQKILKQLKHNQNIPKPRAHLAGIPKSPAKSKAKYISSKISVAKKKEILNVKNKVISSPHLKVPSNHSPVLNIKNSNLSKISKDGLTAKHGKPKKVEDTSGKGSFTDIPTNIDSNKETNSILESDSGTSDSEYERFVKKSKKGLQKKSPKRQKQNTRKGKSYKRSLKRKKNCVSEQKNTYNCDNVTESSRNSKISPFKKQKILHDDAHFENDFNCSDNDVPTRDSSSESGDDDDGIATKTQQVISKACEVKPVSETIVLSNANSSLSYSNSSVSESHINSDLVSSNDETQIVNSVKLEVKHASKTKTISVTNLHESHQNLHVLESNINSVEVRDEFENENIINSIKIERDILPSNLVIDICDSDDECNSGELNASEFSISENVLPASINNTMKSLADSDSEESDIEIIEEVEEPVQTKDKCSAPVLANAPDCLKNAVSRENICVDVKPSIKTRDLDNKSLVNISPVVKSQSVAEIGDKHDVVYRTDICHTKMILEQRTIISSHCSKTQNVPSKGSFQANPDLTVVKHEIGSDDDIIILDSIHSTKAVDLNLTSARNENIKSEPSTSESKLKLLDTIDFETNEWEKKFKDVIPVSSTELLEWYKMEFETYMEMKQANADVEASLKNLQARQAQKMMYVRTLLHKCVTGNQDPKTLAGSAPLPLTEPSKDSKDFISANVQNNCDTPNNSFSLNPQIVSPSSVVQDIKPDVNKLKEGMLSVAIKPKIESIQDDLNSRKILSPKIESDDQQPLKLLLDEKCSVCGKDAVAACQRCAKVFFCSHECGRKFWIDGHVKVCGTK